MTKNVRLLLSLLALVGLASALSSLYVHLQLLRQPNYLSFCDVSATVSCSQVYRSPYAMLGGVPVALLGALWYVAVLVVLAGARWGWPSLKESSTGYIFLLSIAGLGFVLYMAYASFALIKAVCLVCVVTYIAVAGIFIVSGIRTRYPMVTIPRRLLKDARAVVASPAALALVLVFLVGATAAVAFFPRGGAAAPATEGQAAGDRQSEFVRYWESQPRTQIPIAADGASVLIVRFSDFQCPSCAQSYRDYKPVLSRYEARYPGAVKMVFKDYPLDAECNANITRDYHLASCEAAAASRAARAKGRGEAMDDWLYANYQSLTPAAVRQAAVEIGGVADFDAQYPSLITSIKGDIALASILGIKVTPTFFINGVKVEGAMGVPYFELALQLELKKAGKTQ